MNPADLLLAMPKVPQQTNSSDSGLYVLRYAQEFLTRAVCRGAPLERERGGRLPVLRAAQDQVVQRVLRKEGTTRRDEQLPRTWEARRAWATAEKRARMRLFWP